MTSKEIERSSLIQVIDNVADEAFCSEVRQRFDADSRAIFDPQPDYSQRRYLYISGCRDWLPIVTKACLLAQRYASAYLALPEKYAEATYSRIEDDGYVVAKYAPGDDLALHVDGQSSEPGRNGLRLATFLLFLNRCEGGALEFPLQQVEIQPEVGRAVLFPSGWTHPHHVQSAQTDRYILQTWITDPRYVVVDNPDDLDDDEDFDEYDQLGDDEEE